MLVDIDLCIGAALMRARKSRGLTRAHLAGATGAAVSRLAACEAGHTRLDAALLVSASTALDIAPADLLCVHGGPGVSGEARLTIEGAQALLDAYAQRHASRADPSAKPKAKPTRDAR